MKLCGSHAGVSIGEDGPSQMALEDLAAFRAVNGSTVLYPCDGNQTAKLVRAMADLEGISFLRTTRADTEVIYEPDDEFPVGGSRVVRDADDTDVTIVAAGITVHEALKAADELAADEISARVLDCYSVKPIDAETLRSLGTPIVTVEDHWPEGGLGEAVLSALAELEDAPRVVKLGVQRAAALRQAGGAARGRRDRRGGDRGGRATPRARARDRVVSRRPRRARPAGPARRPRAAARSTSPRRRASRARARPRGPRTRARPRPRARTASPASTSVTASHGDPPTRR